MTTTTIARIRAWVALAALPVLMLGVGATCGKDKARSLVLVDVRLGAGVTVEQVEISVTQTGATVGQATIDWPVSASVLQAGIYVSSDTSGAVEVAASGLANALVVAAAAPPGNTSVAPGKTTAPVQLVLQPFRGGGGGNGGAGGGAGVDGAAGSSGAGGTGGLGGTAGTGGGGLGGMAGTGGAAGGGGRAGAGGTGGAPVALPSLTVCTEYYHNENFPNCTESTSGGDIPVYSVAFSPNGKLVASGGANDGRVVIWNVTTTGLVREGHVLPGNGQTYVKFAPDGSRLYLAGRQGLLRAYSVPGFNLVLDAAANPANPAFNLNFWSLAVSSDGAGLVTIGGDMSLRYFTTAALKQEAARSLAPRTPYEIALAPRSGNALYAAIGFYTQDVDVLDVTDPVASGPTVQANTDDEAVAALAFSPDGNTLVTGDYSDRLRFWNVTNRASVTPIGAAITEPLPVDINGVAYFPDGQHLALATGDFFNGGRIRTFRIADRTFQGEAVPEFWPVSVAVSPDGGTLLAGEITCGRIIYCRDP